MDLSQKFGLIVEGAEGAYCPDVAYVEQGNKIFFAWGSRSLTESVDDSKQIVESINEMELVEITGKKYVKDGNWYVEGTYQRSDVENANKRKYGRAIWERIIGDPNSKFQQSVKNGGSVGHTEHPTDGRTDGTKVSMKHLEFKLERDGRVHGRSMLTNNSPGRELQALTADGVRWGVSSRGNGSVGADGTVNEKDFDLETFDAVMKPSTPGAYPAALPGSGKKLGEGIREGKAQDKSDAEQASRTDEGSVPEYHARHAAFTKEAHSIAKPVEGQGNLKTVDRETAHKLAKKHGFTPDDLDKGKLSSEYIDAPHTVFKMKDGNYGVARSDRGESVEAEEFDVTSNLMEQLGLTGGLQRWTNKAGHKYAARRDQNTTHIDKEVPLHNFDGTIHKLPDVAHIEVRKHQNGQWGVHHDYDIGYKPGDTRNETLSMHPNRSSAEHAAMQHLHKVAGVEELGRHIMKGGGHPTPMSNESVQAEEFDVTSNLMEAVPPASDPDEHAQTHAKIVHILTNYDRKQAEAHAKNPRRPYNHYALGHYMGAATGVHDDLKAGNPLHKALSNNLNGSLLRHVAKKLGVQHEYSKWEGVDEMSTVDLNHLIPQTLKGSEATGMSAVEIYAEIAGIHKDANRDQVIAAVQRLAQSKILLPVAGKPGYYKAAPSAADSDEVDERETEQAKIGRTKNRLAMGLEAWIKSYKEMKAAGNPRHREVKKSIEAEIKTHKLHRPTVYEAMGMHESIEEGVEEAQTLIGIDLDTLNESEQTELVGRLMRSLGSVNSYDKTEALPREKAHDLRDWLTSKLIAIHRRYPDALSNKTIQESQGDLSEGKPPKELAYERVVRRLQQSVNDAVAEAADEREKSAALQSQLDSLNETYRRERKLRKAAIRKLAKVGESLAEKAKQLNVAHAAIEELTAGEINPVAAAVEEAVCRNPKLEAWRGLLEKSDSPEQVMQLAESAMAGDGEQGTERAGTYVIRPSLPVGNVMSESVTVRSSMTPVTSRGANAAGAALSRMAGK